MKIWVDADACPGAIKEVILKAALKRSIATVFIANKPIVIPASPMLYAVQVDHGPDVADQYIVTHAEAGDLVITQDIPLAAQLVPKGIHVISLHGTLFTESNIRERLSIRNFMQDLRDSGTKTSGPKPFSTRDKTNFANAFDRILNKVL